MDGERPRVGVAVIIEKEGQVLLGQRLGSHGAGGWQFPGGHLEYGESLAACAAREVAEETGLAVRGIRPVTFTNDIFAAEGKHYVTLYMLANYEGGTPEVLEPHKCARWDWFSWDALPEPLFLPIENLLRAGFDVDSFLAEFSF